MKRTSTGLDILLAILLAGMTYAVFVGVDALERWAAWTQAHEGWDIDGGPAALLGTLVGLVGFAVRRWRKAAADAVTQSRGEADAEAFHQSLLDALETVPVGIVFYDSDDRMAFCNGQFRRLNPAGAGFRGGQTYAENLRRPAELGLIPEAAGHVEEWLGKHLARHQGEAGDFESHIAGIDLLIHEHRTPDGGTLVILEDVTERKRTETALRQSEARLRAIIDNSPASIHLKDTEGRLLVVNKEFERRNRVAAKDALGNTSHDLIPAESADRLRAEEAWVIENRMPRSFERPLKYPDGETGTYLAVKFPVLDASGVLVGIGSISTDVTAQKRVEEQARQLREELAHVDRFRAMGELASGFAHEVNQPLAAINAYASGILKRLRSGEGDRDEFADVMERIAGQAQRAGNIVWRIYRFVRKTPSDRQAMDVNGAIAAAIGMVGSRAEAAGVSIVPNLASGLPSAMADPIQIQQVMLNLFNNAIEAMAEDRARRRLAVATRRAGPAVIEVTVSDTGCGIPPEDRVRLFQPFFTTKTDGMGVGLLVCQTIIEEHEGTLAVASEPGNGTVVTFTLPMVEPRA